MIRYKCDNYDEIGNDDDRMAAMHDDARIYQWNVRKVMRRYDREFADDNPRPDDVIARLKDMMAEIAKLNQPF